MRRLTLQRNFFKNLSVNVLPYSANSLRATKTHTLVLRLDSFFSWWNSSVPLDALTFGFASNDTTGIVFNRCRKVEATFLSDALLILLKPLSLNISHVQFIDRSESNFSAIILTVNRRSELKRYRILQTFSSVLVVKSLPHRLSKPANDSSKQMHDVKSNMCYNPLYLNVPSKCPFLTRQHTSPYRHKTFFPEAGVNFVPWPNRFLGLNHMLDVMAVQFAPSSIDFGTFALNEIPQYNRLILSMSIHVCTYTASEISFWMQRFQRHRVYLVRVNEETFRQLETGQPRHWLF